MDKNIIIRLNTPINVKNNHLDSHLVFWKLSFNINNPLTYTIKISGFNKLKDILNTFIILLMLFNFW